MNWCHIQGLVLIRILDQIVGGIRNYREKWRQSIKFPSHSFSTFFLTFPRGASFVATHGDLLERGLNRAFAVYASPKLH